MASFLRQTASGIDLFVRLTPRSSRDAIENAGSASDGTRHLKVRVRAVPEKGAANDALTKLVAGWLDVPSGAVSVSAGLTARLKTVSVKGDANSLAERARLLAGED